MQDPTKSARHSILGEIGSHFPSWVISVLVAVFVYWTLRNQVLDAYPVPTPSMEPTIEGDPEHGDVVLVDKTFDNRTKPERFGTVVFKQDHPRRIIVKRVVGLPGEYILIHNYDIWVGATATDLHLVRKSPARYADLLVTPWDSTISRDGLLSREWNRERTKAVRRGAATGLDLAGQGVTTNDLLPPERWTKRITRSTRWRSAWNLTWTGQITTGYIDGFGVLQEGSAAAFDFGVRLRVRSFEGARLWVDLRYGERASFALCYEANGKASLWRDGRPFPSASTGVAAPDLVSQPREITFLYLDGGFRLAVDGTDVLDIRVTFDELKEARRRSGRRHVPQNGLAIAASGSRVTVERLAIVHDFHYLSIGPYGSHEPMKIEADEYFVLGDNSQDSRDSRHTGPIRAKDIIGRPLAIAAPWRRHHFIPR